MPPGNPSRDSASHRERRLAPRAARPLARTLLLLALPVGGLGLAAPESSAPPRVPPNPPWGFVGHEMAARAAAAALPSEMPAFFRDAGAQLVHLNPEPDRWRVWEQREMDQAFAYDHYIDLENVPAGCP